MTNKQIYFYRKFLISKKSGKKREIFEPLPLLKSIQRWILDNVLENIPSHASVKSYKKGHSIKSNARFHVGQEYVVKFDLEGFFDHVRIPEVYEVFYGCGYTKAVSAMLSNLCLLDGKLPQGAPSSGALSNIAMRPFDETMFSYARSLKLRYTRYSDDVTLSGTKYNIGEPETLTEFVAATARNSGQKLNRGKTRILGSHTRQKVTGIVVNEKLDVARESRMAIRQEVYYVRRFGIQGHVGRRAGESDLQCLERLIGFLSHIIFVRPDDLYAVKARVDLLLLRNELLRQKGSFSLIERRNKISRSLETSLPS